MKRHPIHLSDKTRLAELQAFVDLCFACMEDYDFKEVANYTGLCLSTVYRLANGEASLCCRFGTIQALGLAAGIRFDWDTGGVSLQRRKVVA